MAKFNTMEFIWNSLDKIENGQKVRYAAEDAAYLWDYGFVDTGKCSKQDWFQVLVPFRQPDGSYVLSRDEFFTLDRHRYDGPIKIPFDPLKINEGKYTDEGFQELVDGAIAPSCGLSSADIKNKVEALKKEFRQSDGLILIAPPAKIKIKDWIDADPSPTRRREFMFEDFLKSEGLFKQQEAVAQQSSLVATPEQQAAVQASTFSQVPTSRTEENAVAFKAMAQAKPKVATKGPATTELKSVKRNKKGLRG